MLQIQIDSSSTISMHINAYQCISMHINAHMNPSSGCLDMFGSLCMFFLIYSNWPTSEEEEETEEEDHEIEVWLQNLTGMIWDGLFLGASATKRILYLNGIDDAVIQDETEQCFEL